MKELKDWPKTKDGRYKCRKEHPMPQNAPGHWQHKGAKCIGENYEGDADYYVCEDCGQKWTKYYY